MRTPPHYVTLSALVLVVFSFYLFASMLTDPAQPASGRWAWLGGFIGCAAVFTLIYGLLSRSSRKAVRHLRKEMPSAELVVVRADDYLLGTVALLRPDIKDPMKLGRYLVLALTDTGFELWGGRDGDVQMLNVPWRYVESIRVQDTEIFYVTYPGIAIRLVGAERTPLRFSPCSLGLAVFRSRSLVQTELLASRISEMRNQPTVPSQRL